MFKKLPDVKLVHHKIVNVLIAHGITDKNEQQKIIIEIMKCFIGE